MLDLQRRCSAGTAGQLAEDHLNRCCQRLMSDTAPKDQDALLAGHVAPGKAHSPRGGESVWKVTKDGRTMACELRDDSRSGAGWDVVVYEEREWSFSRRCADEASARFVAHALEQDHLHSGWTESKDPTDRITE
jgi:hypothetical protein